MTVATTATRKPAFPRATARDLATTEHRRFVELLESLSASDWGRPTDCPEWDVREIALHVLGAMEGQVRLREMVHQARLGKPAAGDGPLIDGITAVQVRERDHLSPSELLERIRDVAPRAALARTTRPGLMRRIPFRQEVGAATEWWTVGYVLDVVYTRDVWMHRVDISRAVGRPLELTDDHDGVIVADVVDEWARRHGQPYHLELAGPAGGVFGSDQPGERLTEDAVEFCRILSGRGSGTGLLSELVPF
jgi:uncharacterized protein (TIGR03083 family)